MTLLEAIKTGKKIYRNGIGHIPGPGSDYSFEEITAEDWEVEEEFLTITQTKLYKSIDKAQDDWEYCGIEAFKETVWKELTK